MSLGMKDTALQHTLQLGMQEITKAWSLAAISYDGIEGKGSITSLHADSHIHINRWHLRNLLVYQFSLTKLKLNTEDAMDRNRWRKQIRDD